MSFASATALHASPADALVRHLLACRRSCGRGFVLRSWCEQAHEALAPRFGTTLALASTFIVLIASLS